MTTFQIQVPDGLYQQTKAFASKENLSLDRLVTLALSEQVAKGYLEERARRGSWEKFLSVLDNVPDVEPEEYDRL